MIIASYLIEAKMSAEYVAFSCRYKTRVFFLRGLVTHGESMVMAAVEVFAKSGPSNAEILYFLFESYQIFTGFF